MKKVLIVEDSADWQEILIRWFTDWGYQVLGPAISGQEALQLFQTQHPDLVTVDGNLAWGEGGLDIAGQLRAVNPTVHILMVTVHGLQFEGRGLSKVHLDYGKFKAMIADLLK